MRRFISFAEGVLRRILRLPILLLARRRGRRPNVPPRRILLLRHDRIGDWVITTPLLSLLRSAWPDAEIDVIAAPRNAPLIQADHRITRVHLYRDSPASRLGLLRDCRRLRYDLALQLVLGRTTLTTLFLRMAAPRAILAGYRNPRNAYMFDVTGVSDSPHFAERTFAAGAAVLATASGAACPPYSLAVTPEAEAWATGLLGAGGLARHGFILLNLSAGGADRTVSSDFCNRVVGALKTDGLVVALTGAPEDHERLETLGRVLGVVVLTAPDIVHAAALYPNALVVITPDTSIVHIASASGRPVVALYPSYGDPAGWGPRGVPARLLIAGTGTTGISEISPELVVKATLELVRAMDEQSSW